MTETNTQAQGVKLDLARLVKPLVWRKSEKVGGINLVAHCAVSLQTYFAADEIHAAEIDARRAARILSALDLDAIAALVEAAKRALKWMEDGRASTDWGFWDWEEGDEYSELRTALARLGGGE